MKRNARKSVKWLLLGLILLIPIALAWIVVSHPMPPGGNLGRSRLLPATKGLAFYSGATQGYTWLDAKTVRQIDSVTVNALIVKDTDIETGIARRTASFAKGKEIGLLDEKSVHLSPDRRWILYTGFYTNTLMRVLGSPLSIQTPRDSPDVANKPITIADSAAWMRDSLHWIELTERTPGADVILVHTVGNPTPRRLVLPQRTNMPGTMPWRMLVGVTERNTALIAEANPNPAVRRSMQFLEVDLKTGWCTPNSALSHVSSLIKAESGSPSLSPQGDRLVWITRDFPTLLTLLVAMARHKSCNIRYDVFTCRLDGSEFTPVDSAEIANGRELMSMVDWLPDGNHISFCFRNTLYTAPTD